MKEAGKTDLRILKALYNGTHLSQIEMERALKLIYLLSKELNSRIK